MANMIEAAAGDLTGTSCYFLRSIYLGRRRILRPASTDLPLAHLKGETMDSKRPARREFLKSGAALAGGFTLGAAAPANAQTPTSPPMIKGDRDQIAYGDRSRFVNSVRIAHGGRPSPDAFG